MNTAFPQDYPPAKDWTILGYLTGVDTVLPGIPVSQVDDFGQDVYYGLVLNSKAAPTQAAIVIRGTEDMLNFTPMRAQARIKTSILDPAAAHQAVCYAAMLDFDTAPDWQSVPLLDTSCCACILGRNS